jgi:hypothetical protein
VLARLPIASFERGSASKSMKLKESSVVQSLLGQVTMRTTRLGTALVVVLLVGGMRPAQAFKQDLHRSITKDSCAATALPRDFCSRIAVEAYNTDSTEWDDLLAHSQMSEGEGLCAAANRVQERMRTLGWQLRAEIDKLAANTRDAEQLVGTIGELVGRAAHTLQDSYAHHGMGNPEHAWFSLQDFCKNTSSAPDLRAGAAEQARAATDAFLVGVAATIRQAAIEASLASHSCPQPYIENDPNARGVCDSTYAPSPFELCGFLAEAEKWDGVDRQWDNTIVGPSLIAAFVDHQSYDLCTEPTLASPPAAPVAVTGGTPSCTSVHMMCLGKADGEGMTPDQASDLQVGNGCSVAFGSRSDTLLAGLALLGLLLVAGRRGVRLARRPR